MILLKRGELMEVSHILNQNQNAICVLEQNLLLFNKEDLHLGICQVSVLRRDFVVSRFEILEAFRYDVPEANFSLIFRIHNTYCFKHFLGELIITCIAC